MTITITARWNSPDGHPVWELNDVDIIDRHVVATPLSTRPTSHNACWLQKRTRCWLIRHFTKHLCHTYLHVRSSDTDTYDSLCPGRPPCLRFTRGAGVSRCLITAWLFTLTPGALFAKTPHRRPLNLYTSRKRRSVSKAKCGTVAPRTALEETWVHSWTTGPGPLHGIWKGVINTGTDARLLITGGGGGTDTEWGLWATPNITQLHSLVGDCIRHVGQRTHDDQLLPNILYVTTTSSGVQIGGGGFDHVLLSETYYWEHFEYSQEYL